MAEPMTDKRVTEIVRAATHGKAIALAGLVRDCAHIDAGKKEEFRAAIGTVWIHGVRELAAEVRRLRTAVNGVAVLLAEDDRLREALIRAEQRLSETCNSRWDLRSVNGPGGRRRELMDLRRDLAAALAGEGAVELRERYMQERYARLGDVETRIFNLFADGDEQGQNLDAMTPQELTDFVMRAVRGEKEATS